jgi:hypothetical protein
MGDPPRNRLPRGSARMAHLLDKRGDGCEGAGKAHKEAFNGSSTAARDGSACEPFFSSNHEQHRGYQRARRVGRQGAPWHVGRVPEAQPSSQQGACRQDNISQPPPWPHRVRPGALALNKPPSAGLACRSKQHRPRQVVQVRKEAGSHHRSTPTRGRWGWGWERAACQPVHRLVR